MNGLSLDLNFTLGTPLTLSKEESLWSLFEFTEKSEPFNERFSRQFEEITSLLKSSNPIIKGIPYFLSAKIDRCLNDFSSYTLSHPLNLEVAQKLYAFASDFKRHESNRCVLWQALPKVSQVFLSQLVLWSEDLRVLKEEIPYQWLGDGVVERANKNEESISDFGDGRLFKVKPIQEDHFPLTNYPGCKLVKADPYRKNKSAIPLLTEKSMGRLAEIFDIRLLEKKIQEGEESILYSNQLLEVFSCYRSAICSVLDIPVHLPLAIGRQGEWTIWSDKKKEPLKNLSCAMINDLQRLFRVEKLWKINVFNSQPNFAVCGDHLFVDGALPLPTFLTEDIDQRHETLIKKLNLHPMAFEEEVRINSLSNWLKKELKAKRFYTQDLVTLHPQALLALRLNRCFSRETIPQLSMALTQLLKADTFEQAFKERGSTLTDQIISLKNEIKGDIMLFVIEKFERKSSTEEFIQSILQLAQNRCEAIAADFMRVLSSSWPFQESIKEHLMLLVGDELLEELNQILHESSQLEDQLLLLREAVLCAPEDIEKINQNLQSVLHDAMQKKYSQEFLKDLQEHQDKFNMSLAK